MGNVNHVTNPSFETNTNGWTIHATGSRSTTVAKDGTYSLRLNGTTGAPGEDYCRYSFTGLTARTKYVASFWIYITTAWDGQDLRPYIENNTGRMTISKTNPNESLRDQWQRLSITFATGVDGNGDVLLTADTNGGTAGNYVYIDAVQLERYEQTDYFDGDSSDSEWVGTTDASKSNRVETSDGRVFSIEDIDGLQLYNFYLDPMKVLRGSRNEAESGDGKTVHSFKLVDRDDTETNISDEVAYLQRMLDLGVEWHGERPKSKSRWIREQTKGESAKRSLIYSYALPLSPYGFADRSLDAQLLVPQIAITRHRAWERPTGITTTEDAVTTMDTIGGLRAIGGTHIYGDMDSRVNIFRLLPNGLTVTNPFTRYWVGIRPENQGTTNFDPVWDCEAWPNSSSRESTDTDKQTKTGSRATNAVRIRFSSGSGSDAMGYRFTTILSDHVGATASDQKDHIGSYYVLMRYQVDASTEIGVQLGYGQSDNLSPSLVNLNEAQYLSSTSSLWRYVNLGEVHIPVSAYRQSFIDTIDDVSFASLHLRAERFSGTGFLWCDVFVLVPSTHYAHVDSISVDVDYRAYLVTHENDKVIHYTRGDGGELLDVVNPETNNWTMPHEGGAIVFAAEQSDRQVDGENFVSWEFITYPRYANYRRYD